jgi:general secretion pathway protein L
MARVIGIDIRSRHVRTVLLSTNLRRIRLEALVEIERDQLPSLEEAVRASFLPLIPGGDSLAAAVDGDVAFVHRLRLPPAALKELDAVVPFELEAQVPVDIDDLVYDFTLLPRQGATSPVDLLAAAVRATHVKERIDLVVKATSREPDRIGVGALPLSNLSAVMPLLQTEAHIALVELGDNRSEIVVLRRGQPVFARTVSIGVAGLPATAAQLSASLRQTMAAAALQISAAIETVYLTGQGALAPGAEAYLAAELGIPTSRMPAPPLDGLTAEQEEQFPRFARAVGLAIGLRGRAKDLDLRSGSLSFQGGFTFLRNKAPLLAALIGVILLSFFFSTWAELRSLADEHEKLAAQLAVVTKTTLGEETTEPDRAKELLDTASARAETDPMPHIDGFDIMVELSKAVPEKTGIPPAPFVHDVEELEFTREHLKIRGVVGSAAEAQQIADALKQNKCFVDPKIGKTSHEVNGTRQKYLLETDLKCPEDATAAKKKADSEEGSK